MNMPYKREPNRYIPCCST